MADTGLSGPSPRELEAPRGQEQGLPGKQREVPLRGGMWLPSCWREKKGEGSAGPGWVLVGGY